MLLFFWCSLLIAPIARLGGGRAERVYKKSSSSSADTRSTFGDLKMKNQKEEKNDIKRVFQSRTRNNDDRSTTSQSEEKFEVEIEIFKLKKCDGEAQPLEPPTIFNAFFTFLYLLQIFFLLFFFGCFVCLCVLCVIFSLSFLLEFHFIYIIFVRWIFNFIYIYSIASSSCLFIFFNYHSDFSPLFISLIFTDKRRWLL